MSEKNTTLESRAVACKAWKWMDGMRFGPTTQGGSFPHVPAGAWYRIEEGCDSIADAVSEGQFGTLDDNNYADRLARVLPDLTDPATLGCLFVLVREAQGEPSGQLVFRWSHQLARFQWCFDTPPISEIGKTPSEWYPRNRSAGDTEAEALVAALEAAP